MFHRTFLPFNMYVDYFSELRLWNISFCSMAELCLLSIERSRRTVVCVIFLCSMASIFLSSLFPYVSYLFIRDRISLSSAFKI